MSPCWLNSGDGNCCVDVRPMIWARVAKSERPACCRALRFTSAKRTCSITCLLGEPLGNCSMLMTWCFGIAARASSAERSMTSLFDTAPERITASSVTETLMSSVGKSCMKFCCRLVTPGSTTMS